MSISITIDQQHIPCQSGDTIMDAAAAAKVYIPHLCHHPELSPYGSCKLCTVKVNGRLVSACTHRVSDGDIVENNSDELTQLRRQITQLLFVEGNHYCPSCERSGNCQLQATAYALDMEENYFHQRYPRRELDGSHPDLLLDRDRCIHCGLCVRASAAEGKHQFSIGGRGSHAHLVVNSDSGTLADLSIDSDDWAANICPVGALINKGEGFSIPIGERLYDQQHIDEIGNLRPVIIHTDREGDA